MIINCLKAYLFSLIVYVRRPFSCPRIRLMFKNGKLQLSAHTKLEKQINELNYEMKWMCFYCNWWALWESIMDNCVFVYRWIAAYFNVIFCLELNIKAHSPSEALFIIIFTTINYKLRKKNKTKVIYAQTTEFCSKH